MTKITKKPAPDRSKIALDDNLKINSWTGICGVSRSQLQRQRLPVIYPNAR
jgi:hypothetical protein